jgi:hypothetical protein
MAVLSGGCLGGCPPRWAGSVMLDPGIAGVCWGAFVVCVHCSCQAGLYIVVFLQKSPVHVQVHLLDCRRIGIS